MNLLMTPEEFNDLGLLCQGSADPVRKYNEDLAPEDRKQKLNPDNVPLWSIECSVKDGGTTIFNVQMASTVEPEVSPGLIRFGGLTASTYPDGRRNVVTFRADTFTQESAPSVKRTAPPVPAGSAA
ncbi:MAG: hypothetical protein AAF962_08865 [Actinomycetota bacterium]